VRLLDLDDHVTKRHGLVVRDVAGLSTSTWYRMVRSGQIEQIHPGVARLVGTPRTFVQHIAAAVWAIGGGAMASHRSSAHLHGFPVSPRPPLVDVLVAERSRNPTLAGVLVHRPVDTQRLTPQHPAGIRSTGVLRTLVDLGAVAPELVSGAVGHALSTRQIDVGAIAATLGDHGGKGRAGVGPLRRALDDWTVDAKPTDSVLESAFARLVERNGLPSYDFHPMIEGWEVDFRFRGTNVVIECDGWTTHGLDRARFERDRRRDSDLIAAGWIVGRFTYRAITATAADTARRIRGLLGAPTSTRL
jgi:very-short-patch-repair endonuclease